MHTVFVLLQYWLYLVIMLCTEAGWCQVRNIFYLAAAIYYVAAAT